MPPRLMGRGGTSRGRRKVGFEGEGDCFGEARGGGGVYLYLRYLK